MDGSGVVKIILNFLAKKDYKVSCPGISPGMIKPPLEPARWLWSSPRLKQAMIQKGILLSSTSQNSNAANFNCLLKTIFLTSIFVLPFYDFELIMTFL